MEINPSKQQFTNHEWDIINQIIITLAIIIHEYIRDYKNPQQVMKKYSRLTSSPTNLTRVFRTIILRNMNSEKGLYPAQIKKEIIRISRELYEKSQELEDFLSNPANLSKILKEIDHQDQTRIIASITGKKKIKEQSPKSIPRKRKQRDYQEEIPAGPPVVKKLTRTLEDYIRVLSNPQALNYMRVGHNLNHHFLC